MGEQLAKAEFDTLPEKLAFEKGLTFGWAEELEVISYMGHFDETKNENGKYQWSVRVQPLKSL